MTSDLPYDPPEPEVKPGLSASPTEAEPPEDDDDRAADAAVDEGDES